MNLHNEIMNIPADPEKHEFRFSHAIAFKMGHRDARHAAAELALKYELYIEKLEELAAELDGCLISGSVDLGRIRVEYGL